MTLSAGTHSDDHDDVPGTGLAPTIEAGGIDPFLAKADAEPAPPRSWHARLLDYSAHAAMIVGLIGFAWTVSGHVVTRDPSAPADLPTKAAALETPKPVAVTEAPKVDEVAELRRANHQMAADIKALRASLDTLRANVGKTPDQVRALSASVDDVKNGLAATKGETHAEVAQLSGKLEALRHEREAAAKAPQPLDRVAKAERQAPDATPTGSIPPEAAVKVPTPPSKPASLAGAEEAQAKQIIAGWVVRDVYDGVAYVEGKRGVLEVVPGVSLPGAGVVKSIDRHGNGWTVTTTKGLVAYAAPPREVRRAAPQQQRDFYPYDY